MLWQSDLKQKHLIERGEIMVELDQFKYTLSTFEEPLIEVRDSL